MKKKVFAVSVLVLCLAIIATGTAAYFSARDTAHNVITTGNVDIALVEKQEKDGQLTDYPRGPISGALPGSVVSKIVSVKNTGTGDAWIRVRADKSITLDPDAPEALPAGQAPDISLLKLNIDTVHWVDGGDGWYYCRREIPAGQSTHELFTTVTFDADMGNAYQGCTAEILVRAEAVQSKNNPLPASGDYSQIPGWPTK